MSRFLFCCYSEISNEKHFKRERVYSGLYFKGTVHQNGDVKTTGQLVISYPQLEAEHPGCKQTAKLTSLTVSLFVIEHSTVIYSRHFHLLLASECPVFK